MYGVNKAIILGHLGADPEVKRLDSGKIVARLRIATTEAYKAKDTGEKKEQTEWHTVNFWNRQAEIAEQYLKKGSLVYVEGKITTREWEDKDGNKRYTTEILGLSLSMLDNRGNQNGSRPPMPQEEPAHVSQSSQQNAPNPAKSNTDSAPLEDNTEDDLPF